MSDSGYSRRKILAAVTGVGAAGLSAGMATRAYLFDRQVFPGNRLQTGKLSLEIAGTGLEDADYVSGFPDDSDFDNGDTISVAFPDLEPGDEGVFTTAYRLCDNPGRVWVRSRVVGAADTDLEEYLGVRLLSRPDCEGETDDENLLFEGTLGELHREYSRGKHLGCQYLGKVEHDEDTGTFEFDDPDEGDVTDQDPPTFEFSTEDGETVTIVLTNVVTNDDGEIIEFDYETVDGAGVCKVVVAGGGDPPGPKRTEYNYEGCEQSDGGLTPPDNDHSGGVHGLSHVEFYACRACRECPPGCIDLQWTFDEEPPEELLDDTLELRFEFLAIQCRHQTEPTNPWT